MTSCSQGSSAHSGKQVKSTDERLNEDETLTRLSQSCAIMNKCMFNANMTLPQKP